MSKYEEDLARELSIPQWEFLTDHFEGSRPIYARDAVRWNDTRIRVALLTRELVRLHPPPHVSSKATHTTLTKKGHAVMCAALGLMADMLTKNGFNKPKIIEKNGYGKFVIERSLHPADVESLAGGES